MKMKVVSKLPLSVKMGIINKTLSIKRVDKFCSKFNTLCASNDFMKDAKYVVYNRYMEDNKSRTCKSINTLLFVDKNSKVVGFVKGKDNWAFDIIKT